MKGIIVEKERGHFIIVTKNGQFVRVRSKEGYSIGEEYEEKNSFFKITQVISSIKYESFASINLGFSKGVATALASIFLVFGISTVAYAYMSPYNYVNIDVNPSLELGVNRFHRITKAMGLNEDGTGILRELALKNKSIDEAITIIMEALEQKGYLNEDLQNELLVTVTGKDEIKTKDMEKQLGDVVQQQLDEENLKKTPVMTATATLERYREAQKLGISPGKLNLIEKLQVVQPEIKYEDYVNVSVKDIMKTIIEGKKEASTEEKQEVNSKAEENSGEPIKFENKEAPKEQENINNDEKNKGSNEVKDNNNNGNVNSNKAKEKNNEVEIKENSKEKEKEKDKEEKNNKDKHDNNKDKNQNKDYEKKNKD